MITDATNKRRRFWVWANCLTSGAAIVGACRVEYMPVAIVLGAWAGGCIGLTIVWLVAPFEAES